LSCRTSFPTISPAFLSHISDRYLGTFTSQRPLDAFSVFTVEEAKAVVVEVDANLLVAISTVGRNRKVKLFDKVI